MRPCTVPFGTVSHQQCPRWFKDKTEFEDMGKAGADTCWPREVVLEVLWRVVGALGGLGGLDPNSWRWDGEGELGGPTGS